MSMTPVLDMEARALLDSDRAAEPQMANFQ